MNEYDGLYPIVYNQDNETGAPEKPNQTTSAQYNQYGYIFPDENAHSPWVNNAMFPGAKER